MFARAFVALALAVILIAGCSDSGGPAGPGNPSLSVNDRTVVEGAIATFTISLTQSLSNEVTFQYATQNGTAVAPGDFTAIPLTSDTIPAGQTSVQVNVTTIDDAAIEGSERFTLVVSSLAGVDAGDLTGEGTITDNDGAVSYAASVQPIITSRCALSGCHGGTSASGGLAMGNGSWNVVRNASGNNGPVVVAGNSGASNLYLKVTPTPPFGSRMPLSGSFLSTAEQNNIRDWIDQGALNN